MKKIDLLLKEFVFLLNAYWPNIVSLAESSNNYFLDDWLQANWETIVEAGLFESTPIYLEFYGDGAEVNDDSSRVSIPDASPTHAIHCFPKTGNSAYDHLSKMDILFPKTGFLLDSFVSLQDGWYEVKPPFDHTLVNPDDDVKAFSNKDLRYDVVELQPLGF